MPLADVDDLSEPVAQSRYCRPKSLHYAVCRVGLFALGVAMMMNQNRRLVPMFATPVMRVKSLLELQQPSIEHGIAMAMFLSFLYYNVFPSLLTFQFGYPCSGDKDSPIRQAGWIAAEILESYVHAAT